MTCFESRKNNFWIHEYLLYYYSYFPVFFFKLLKQKNFLEKSGKKEKGTEGRRNQSKEKEIIFLHTDSLIQKQFIKIVIFSFSFCSAYQILKQL